MKRKLYAVNLFSLVSSTPAVQYSLFKQKAYRLRMSVIKYGTASNGTGAPIAAVHSPGNRNPEPSDNIKNISGTVIYYRTWPGYRKNTLIV